SVALGVTLAYALARRGVQRARTWHVGLGLTVALGSAVFDLGLHPQFYHYSHVWGGMLGPIYDEDLAVRPGLFAFRGVTLLWAALCVAVGRRHLRATGLVLLALGGAYAFRGPLGFNTLPATLHRALGPPLRTPHFDLYGEGLTPQEAEYRYAWLAARLGTWPRQRVEVFVYPNVATKRRLTGAGHTSVAPVWLATPQVHLVREAVEAHFGHELVHAFSRAFGLPILKASRHVGLVEGLAVAFEPPDGVPGPHAQVSAAALAAGDTLLARRMARALGAGGFWTGRGAVSYTTMGSFVQHLAARYGTARLRDIYARGNFEQVYGRPVQALADEWQRYVLHDLSRVGLGAGPLATARFSVPSLFERPSPHYVPSYVRCTEEAVVLLGRGDTLRALTSLEAALRQAPAYVPALDLWARLRLARGETRFVVGRLRAASLPVLDARLGDAWAMLGQPDSARARYRLARRRVPAYAHEQAALLWLREAHAASPEAIRALYRSPLPVQACGADVSRMVPAHPFEPALPWPKPDSLPGLAARMEAVRTAWAGRCEEAARQFQRLGDEDAAAYWRDWAAAARFSIPSIVR
ncbi:MAG TPA: hypothetical protein VD948_12430, partial [Rhodothermales bacterium]|nr:hypothetical protein [Rhodothermales bacterium]